MSQIRCLLARTGPGMLADIVEQIIENNLDVEMIKRVDDQDDDLSQMREHDFNVAVIEFPSSEMPAIYHQLVDKYPSIVIAGLVGDGRRLCISIDNPGPVELTEMIRLAVARNAN